MTRMFGLSCALAEIEKINNAAAQTMPRSTLVILTDDPLLFFGFKRAFLNTGSGFYYLFGRPPSPCALLMRVEYLISNIRARIEELLSICERFSDIQA